MRSAGDRLSAGTLPGPSEAALPGVTTFVDEKVVDLPINEVFDGLLAIGRGEQRGSYLAASAATAMRGQAVRTFVPVVKGVGVRLEQAVARLAEYTPYRRLVILQESPWESRTEILLTALGSGTRVSTRTSVPVQTVEQVADMLDGDPRGSGDRGGPDRAPSPTRRIALVTSLSGHSSLYGRSTVNCAKLAERRINAESGLLGQPVEVTVIDDASSAEHGLAQLLAADAHRGLDAAVGVHSSAIASAVDASGWAENKPYLYAPLSESTLPQRSLIAVGDTEQEQLELAIPHLHSIHGAGARWALVGSDFSWPRAVNRRARQLITSLGGEVVREVYADPETPDVEELAREVLAEKPDIIVSSLVGWGMIGFEELLYRAELRPRGSSLSLLLDECSRELLGEAADGIWTATSYLPALDTVENQGFVGDYREAFGELAPPISFLGEATYEALLLLVGSANRAGSTSPGAVREELSQARLTGPRGSLEVGTNGRLRAPMRLAQATAHGWNLLPAAG